MLRIAFCKRAVDIEISRREALEAKDEKRVLILEAAGEDVRQCLIDLETRMLGLPGYTEDLETPWA